MARLFSKDYHEKSASWYFNHAIIVLEKGELQHWHSVDESGHYHLRFFPIEARRQYFSDRVDIVYDPAEQKVLSHDCSECRDADSCRHYLSVLRYAYHHLKTDIFEIPVVETCERPDLRADEKWQEILKESAWQVEGLYNPDTDKVRFHYAAFEPLDMLLLARVAQGDIPEDADARQVTEYRRNLGAFSDPLLALLGLIMQKRASFSAKGRFFSLYKKDMPAALALMQNAGERFSVKETGEVLEFVDTPYPLSLRIEPSGKKRYVVYPVILDEYSAYYPGFPTWLLFRNQVRKVYLPLRDEAIHQLMQGELRLGAKELVFYRTIAHREFQRNGIYLDFDKEIDLPQTFSETPRMRLSLRKNAADVLLEGSLVYERDVEVPLSVVRFGASLVRCDYRQDDATGNAWFHIPPEVFSQAELLVKRLPQADTQRLEMHSQLLFSGEEAIAELRDVMFELSEQDWDIEIDPALNDVFIRKVPLKVEIFARRSDEIDWFSYDVTYRYQDYSFTHTELKEFFRSREEFLHTRDGRIFFFTNREVFDEVERLIRNSEAKADTVYRSRMMNLPYYQRLMQENRAFRVLGDEWLEQMSKDLLRRHLERPELLPAYLQTVLRGYQKQGVEWIRMLQHYRLNGILADEMGLGKTIQALTAILVSPETKPSLVICPKTLLYNWAAEIEKFHTNIPYLIIEGNKAERAELLRNPNAKLLIISYSIVLNDIEMLKDMQFEWVVLDEAQNIKNVSAQRTSAIKKLRSDHRLALTGTPVENSITEMWSIFDFLMPGYLGTLNRFKQQYLNTENPEAANQALARVIAPFMQRRVKKDVLLELPDKQEQVSWCKLNPVQEKTYLQILETVRKQLFPAPGSDIPNYIHILTALTKLRQVCNHPHLANPDVLPDPAASAKLEQLVELVSDSIASGHKVLVFSQFVQMLKIIRTVFDGLGVEYSYLDGQTKDRMKVVSEFEQNPARRLFLISLKAGGTGLNLISADTVILFDPWWNPMVESQAIDRTHRIGQVNKVQVFRLITKGTVEEKIAALQQSKLAMFDALVSDGRQLLATLADEDIRGLFDYQ